MYRLLKHGVIKAASIISFILMFMPDNIFLRLPHIETFPVEVNIIISKILVFIAIVILLIVHAIRRKSITISGTNYRIKVSYGDIFDDPYSKKLIPFDECFSTNIGTAPADIKPNSICGQFLNIHPISNLQDLIDSCGLIEEKTKSEYNQKPRFRSGLLIPHDDYFLMAFAKLDCNGLGYMKREEFIDCLSVLWKELNKYYGNASVCMPILGSGITRFDDTSLTQQELLDLIICSYKMSAYKLKLPAELHIICKRIDGFSLNRIGTYI